MASAAKFVNKRRAPLSFDHDGWFTDPHAPQSGGTRGLIIQRHFQMVPFPGNRLVHLQMDGVESFVYSNDDKIAGVGAETDVGPSAINRVVIPANSSLHKIKVLA